jgi:hypothetical protein
MRSLRHFFHAVVFILRLLPPFVWWVRTRPAAGGADNRRPVCPDQANLSVSLRERQVGSVELVNRQPIPVEAAPDVANPAPAGHAAGNAPIQPVRMGGTPAARSFRVDAREVLLRRAIAADAPTWRPLPVDVLNHYARVARARTGPILKVEGLMVIQATLPTIWVPALLN